MYSSMVLCVVLNKLNVFISALHCVYLASLEPINVAYSCIVFCTNAISCDTTHNLFSRVLQFQTSDRTLVLPLLSELTLCKRVHGCCTGVCIILGQPIEDRLLPAEHIPTLTHPICRSWTNVCCECVGVFVCIRFGTPRQVSAQQNTS